jgi:hypothetical protein
MPKPFDIGEDHLDHAIMILGSEDFLISQPHLKQRGFPVRRGNSNELREGIAFRRCEIVAPIFQLEDPVPAHQAPAHPTIQQITRDPFSSSRMVRIIRAQSNDRSTISASIYYTLFGKANRSVDIAKVDERVRPRRVRGGQVRVEAAISGVENCRDKRLVGVMCRRVGMNRALPFKRLNGASNRTCDGRRSHPA